MNRCSVRKGVCAAQSARDWELDRLLTVALFRGLTAGMCTVTPQMRLWTYVTAWASYHRNDWPQTRLWAVLIKVRQAQQG